MEADLQRQTLRAELDSLRRRPSSLVRDVAGTTLGTVVLTKLLPRVLGRRAPWLVYGWLAIQAWRRLFPPGRARRPGRH